MEIQDLKIVLADDEMSIRLLTAEVFKTLGVPKGNIFVAENGEQALALHKEKDADLVWSDTEMPKMNGLKLAEAIRKQEEGSAKHTVIILTSGNDFKEAASDAGADDFLPKPIGRDLIKSTLNTVLMCLPARAAAPITPEVRP
jgi:two-component system response regulator YesN